MAAIPRGTIPPPRPPKRPGPILVRSDEGREIMRFLRQRLDIPDGCQRVSVHLDIDDVVRVDCSYTPRPDQ